MRRRDLGWSQKRVDGVLPAIDEVHDAGREADAVDQLEDGSIDERVLLGGLQMNVLPQAIAKGRNQSAP